MGLPRPPICFGRHSTACLAIAEHLRCVCAALALAVAVTWVGAAGLCALEGDAELEAMGHTAAMQARLRAELAPETYHDLVAGGWWTEVAPESGAGRAWSMVDWASAKRPLLFAFTLSSTVGYGNAPLRTDAGRLFATLFSAIAIPVTIAVSMFVAAQVTSSVQVVLLSVTHPSGETFRKYDVNDDGSVEKNELCTALQDMGLWHATERTADLIIEHMQPGGDRLDFAQFCHAVSVLLPPKVEAQHRHARLLAAVFACAAWLGIGAAVFAHFEGWPLREALWYSWITLTTIGLGDFVPRTPEGELVAVLWGTAGLGLLAMLMSTISDKIAQATSLEDPDEEPEPSDMEMCELRVRHLLRRSSHFLTLSVRRRLPHARTVSQLRPAQPCTWRSPSAPAGCNTEALLPDGPG